MAGYQMSTAELVRLGLIALQVEPAQVQQQPISGNTYTPSRQREQKRQAPHQSRQRCHAMDPARHGGKKNHGGRNAKGPKPS